MSNNEIHTSSPAAYENRYVAPVLSVFLILICLLFEPHLKNGFTLPKELLLYGSAAILISISLISLVIRGRLVILLKAGMIPIALILILVLLSLTYTPSPHAAGDEVLMWLSYLILFFFAAQLPADQIGKVIICSLIAGTIMGVLTTLQYLNIDPLPLRGGQYKIYSTLGNPNYVGGYLSLIIPASLGLLVFRGLKSKAALVSAYAALLTCAFALVLTHSRGAMLGAGLSTLILLGIAASRRARSTKWILVMILILGIVAMIINMGVTRVDEKTGKTSAQWRLLTWQVIVEMIKERPFLGWGVGSLNLVYLEYQADLLGEKDDPVTLIYASGVLKRAHNEFLQLAAEEGLAAPILFIILIITCTAVAFKSKPVAYGLAASLISFAIFSLTNFPLRLAATGYPFFVFAGLSLSSQRSVKVKMEAHGLIRRGGLAIAAILILAQTFSYCYSRLVTEALFTQGYYSYNMDRPETALGFFRRVLARKPHDGMTRLYSGICLSMLKRYDEAKSEILESLKTYSEMYSFLELGNLYAVTGEHEKAVYLLRLCTRIVPVDPQPHFCLAYAYFVSGNLGQAIDEYNRVLNLDPDYPEARQNLELAIQAQEKMEKNQE